MANSISHASLPYPIKNARFTLAVPYLDADGDPTDPTTPDTEVSQDGGAFADAAEEMTTITGSNGMGYITLTGAEMNNSCVGVACKVASGPKATLATLYPRNLPILASGTASAGAAGTITLASSITYDITGCFIRTTGGTGGGGTGGANNQARRITAYNTSTQVATVTPNWETTPDNTTTYDVLLPEGVTIQMIKTLVPTTPGNTLDVSSGGEAGLDWANIGSKTTSNALTNTTIAATQQVDVNTIKTQSVTCSAGVTVGAFVGNATAAISVDASGKLLLQATQSGVTIPTVTTVTNQLTAAQIATGVWQDTTAGDFTVALSIGKSIMNGVSLGTGLTVAAVSGAVGSVTGAVGSVTGNVGGNVTGSVGSIASGGIAAASFAAGAIDAAAIAANAIGASELATDAVSEIAAAVWDLATSGHTTSGTFGAAAVAAGGAGDPWSTSIPGAYGAGTAGYIVGNNLNVALSVIAAYIDTEVAAIKAKTDNLPAAPAAVGDIPTAAQNAAGLLDLAAGVETNRTVRQALRLMLAALVGKLSGAATTTVAIRDTNDSVNRISATVDADGNRSAVTLDAS